MGSGRVGLEGRGEVRAECAAGMCSGGGRNAWQREEVTPPAPQRAEVEAGQGPGPVSGILAGCAHRVVELGFGGKTPPHLPFSFLGAAFCGGDCWPGAPVDGSHCAPGPRLLDGLWEDVFGSRWKRFLPPPAPCCSWGTAGGGVS